MKDMRSIQDMVEKFDLLSINQTSTQIKLQEAWKASRDSNFPIYFIKKKRTENEEQQFRLMRSSTRKTMRDGGRTQQVEECFTRDTRKL